MMAWTLGKNVWLAPDLGTVSTMNDEQTPAAGILAGRYELGAVLGAGGMGTVWDAVDHRLGRPVAVKTLRADLAEQPSARRRFEAEAHAAARLAHPNVVMVFDTGDDDGVPFLVMERLPGRTLADELARGSLPMDRVCEVARETLAALAAAHDAGVLHRDVKPGNLLLTEDGRVKVSDFGIAKTVDDLDQTLTVELVATPAYLAPERLAGEPASPRTDLYAVGVMLYEAVAGRRPFEGDTAVAVMLAIEQGRVQPLRSLRPDLPADLVAVIERAMARDPERRFASASEMSAALTPVSDPDPTVPIDHARAETAEDTVRVAPRSASDSVRPPTRTLHLPARTAARDHPRPPRSRRLLGFRVGAAVAAIIFGAFAASADHPRPAGSQSAPSTSASPVTSPTATLPAPLEDALHRLERSVAR